jgi:hypothetical protein
MGQDISPVLEGWDFQPHELNVRLIRGLDGKEKIQMRIDLGLLQMDTDGRPDGKRPYECESVFEYYLAEAKKYGDEYRLGSEEVDELFREAWQYYHRYLCLFHLANYELVVRDTERNLRLFAFVRKHSKKRREQWRLDQYRPYVLMMHTRAKAMLALAMGDRPAAICAIDEGCKQIETFLEEYGRSKEGNDYFELEYLRRWPDELREAEEPAHPPIPEDGEEDVAKLRAHLQKAIDREDYEIAALLRDKIKRKGSQDYNNPKE